MKFITAFILLITVQFSSAAISESYPINPSDDGTRYGNQGNKPMLSLLLLKGAGSAISSNGQYITYATEHENLLDPLTIDYIVHRFDRNLNLTLSSERIMKNSKKGGASFSLIYFESETSDSILFSHESEINSGSQPVGVYRYDFNNNEVSNYKTDVEILWSVSPNGQFLKYTKYGEIYVFDKEANEEKLVPVSYTLSNGNVVNFDKLSGTHGLDINDQGSMILAADYASKVLEGASRFYQYNIKTGDLISIKDMLPSNYDINITKGTQHTALISNNDQYITLPARNIAGELVIVLIDTFSSSVIEHKVPFEVYGYGGLLPRLITDKGVVQYVRQDSGTDSENGGTEFYLYDFISNQVIDRKAAMPSDQSATEYQVNLIDQFSANGDVAIAYDLIMKVVEDNIEFDSNLGWVSLSSENVNEISISPADLVIDPYTSQASLFSIDVSGSDIYGLDVSCNLSNTSLSITQARYIDLFGSQNSMILPLISDISSITGTETLIAPELPFTGSNGFLLADVIAEFTTEDIEITCVAQISDEHGQLLQVGLTPALIRIDDGVHGGVGSVSGVVEIPEGSNLSGVEVVLTIDGRQVLIVTDETGLFEFDGLRDGDFTISLASENYVQSCQVANVAEGISVDLGLIELLAGDVNADGNIDIADFTFMAARYRSNQGEADYDVKADLNKDGTINIQDLAILGSHFGSTQCNSLQQ